jgi:hypothetical protein
MSRLIGAHHLRAQLVAVAQVLADERLVLTVALAPSLATRSLQRRLVGRHACRLGSAVCLCEQAVVPAPDEWWRQRGAVGTGGRAAECVERRTRRTRRCAAALLQCAAVRASACVHAHRVRNSFSSSVPLSSRSAPTKAASCSLTDPASSSPTRAFIARIASLIESTPSPANAHAHQIRAAEAADQCAVAPGHARLCKARPNRTRAHCSCRTA